MKNLTHAMETALGAEVSKLCYCWRIKRTDGMIVGFTKHDKDITFASAPIFPQRVR